MPILYIIQQHPNYIALLCFSELAVRDGRDSPVSAPWPFQPLALFASQYLQYKLEATINIFPVFFIKQSKSPDVGLVFASKRESHKWEMPSSKGRDCMSEHGRKLKKLFSLFIPLHCNYSTTALIFPATNSWFYIYPCYVKTALPREEVLCLT